MPATLPIAAVHNAWLARLIGWRVAGLQRGRQRLHGWRCRWLVLVLAATFGWGTSAQAAKVIFVKLYVDEEEATVEHVWQARLTKRLDAASEIISQYADVRFSVIGYGTWQSDDRLQELTRSLREFEQEVDTGKARIAIAFSSQYKFQSGRNNLGGTRGPMRSHILIRENAQSILEPERLEVLVHELGHFLCAAHSASPTSAMRPVVGDGQPRAASFRIGFDPLNARILRHVAREMRDGHVNRFRDLSPQTLVRLRGFYMELARQLPEDRTAKKYLQVIDILLRQQPSPVDPGQVVIPSASWGSKSSK